MDPDETQVETPEVPAVETPTLPDSPWAKDLAGYIEDPNAQIAADKYVREKWQPHVTKLEQQYAETQHAREMYNDLLTNPQETFLAIANELFPEQFDQLAGLFEPEVEAPSPEQAAALPPAVQEMVSEYEQFKAQQLYDQQFSALQAAHPDTQIDKEMFDPFLVATDGDWNSAFEKYSAWASKWQPATPDPEPVVTDPPPATLGTAESAATPSAVPPVQEKYDSLSDAFDAAMKEMKSAAPPVVG